MLDHRFLVGSCRVERKPQRFRVAPGRPCDARLVARQDTPHRLDDQRLAVVVPGFHGQHGAGVVRQIDQHQMAAHRHVVLSLQQRNVQGELALVGGIMPPANGVELLLRHQQALDFLYHEGVVGLIKPVQASMHVHRIVVHLQLLPEADLGLIGGQAGLLRRLVAGVQVASHRRPAAQLRHQLDAAGEDHPREQVADAQPQGAGCGVKSNCHGVALYCVEKGIERMRDAGILWVRTNVRPKRLSCGEISDAPFRTQ